MNSFWLLSDVKEYLVSVVPEMFLILDCGIMALRTLMGGLLVLQGDDAIVDEGLQGLLSSLSNIILSCFQPFLLGLWTNLVWMLRASRKMTAWV